jgi:alkanesulfonate monooxygenase SsuD/methylene tetrahydromethanopterin reductase-like flavin-dependent oxidoreductase (luciferase family)
VRERACPVTVRRAARVQARSGGWRDAARPVRDLWDSWEDEAIVRDTATGRYLDRDRLHCVDFQGATFSVKGPSITARPPQGHLVVMAPARLAAAVRPDVALVDGPLPPGVPTGPSGPHR